MGKKVKISLVVEANALYHIADPTPENIDALTFLSDDNKGISSSGKNEDFQSNVYINNDVKWIANPMFPKAEDKDYKISIDSIVYENKDNDTDFFDETTISANGDDKTTVTAKVKNNPQLDGLIDIYTINFSIHPPKKGAIKNGLHIDPKLKANPD